MNMDTRSLNEIIEKNIALLDIETTSADERRVSQLADRASLIARGKALPDEEPLDFNAYFDLPSDEPVELEKVRQKKPCDAVPEQIRKYLDCCAAARRGIDKLTVCRFLAERFAGIADKVLPAVIPDDPQPRIAYLKNAYADDAFRRFSEVIGDPIVSYVSDFAAVCEEVYYGRADMCILPLDSSRDAKLISFYRLIEKYELKIVMSCDVASMDSGVNTRYALLRKTASLMSGKPVGNREMFFEFSFVPDESSGLADVLTAAERCGLSLYKVDALPLTYTDNEFSFDVILRCQELPRVFALYMSLAVPQYELLGVYRHIGVS